MAFSDLVKRLSPGRRRIAPQRDTMVYPKLMQLGANGRRDQRLVMKPTPRNLRYFATTVYARRAINAIKQPIGMLDWEIRPRKGVAMSRELERQIEVATYCFSHPNGDDSFRSLAEQVLEDVMLGAGAIEMQLSGDPLRPLWLWPVDGLSIQIYPGWSGDPAEARYAQTVGFGRYDGTTAQINLRNDELVYLKPNPTTESPFGLGPLEVAFQSVSRILGVGDFAGKVASNARPSIFIDMGSAAGDAAVAAFRAYWENEVEGEGKVPIIGISDEIAGTGKARGPMVQKLFPDGDNALFLKWQEFLKSEIATAFSLSPMNLGVERDVNRNTAEVAEDRDRDHAIKPVAHLLSSHLTREALHAKLGFSQLEHRFLGLDPEDEKNLAEVYQLEFKNNATTPNEYRARRGIPPMTNAWGDMTFADVQIATQSARAGDTIDPDLDDFETRVSVNKPPAAKAPGSKKAA